MRLQEAAKGRQKHHLAELSGFATREGRILVDLLLAVRGGVDAGLNP